MKAFLFWEVVRHRRGHFAAVKGREPAANGGPVNGDVHRTARPGVARGTGVACVAPAPLLYFVFDLMILAGRDLTRKALETRRELLEHRVLPRLIEPVRYAAPLRRASRCWSVRVNRVIGGCTLGARTFDALIVGFYEDNRLIYAARTRNGFTPAAREQLFKKLRRLETPECPFANLPEAKSGRWGQGLSRAKMADCRWLKPILVGQFEFLEWTGENHLRHTRFIGLREDKVARRVRRETAVREPGVCRNAELVGARARPSSASTAARSVALALTGVYRSGTRFHGSNQAYRRPHALALRLMPAFS
jgi:bifunctional non-homologous end joining protein LigD